MALNLSLNAEGLTVGRLRPALTGPIAPVAAVALVIVILPLVVSDLFLLLQLTPFMLFQERPARDAALDGQTQKRDLAVSQALAGLLQVVHQRRDAIRESRTLSVDAASSRLNSPCRRVCQGVSARFLRASPIRCAWRRPSFG